MNTSSLTRSFTAASLVLAGLAVGISHAQTVITVNGAACSAASVTMGAGTINIDTTGCGSLPPPTTGAPTISLVSPGLGTTGTTVTVSGTGFAGASVTIGGVAAVITASSATSITTTVPGSAPIAAGSLVVTTASGSATASFTVIPAGGGEFSVDGVALPSISKTPFTTPTHTGLNGAGFRINAYAMDPARCNATPALGRSWQHNIDILDFKNRAATEVFSIAANEALSYKFTVPMEEVYGGFTYQENVSSGANTAPAFMTVSSAPCDFDATKVPDGTTVYSVCYQTSIAGVGVPWSNASAPLPSNYCKLTKGQTYYVNIRFQDARPVSQGGSPTSLSCPNSTCGGTLAFN